MEHSVQIVPIATNLHSFPAFGGLVRAENRPVGQVSASQVSNILCQTETGRVEGVGLRQQSQVGLGGPLRGPLTPQ